MNRIDNFIRSHLVRPAAAIVNRVIEVIKSIAAKTFNNLNQCYSFCTTLKNRVFKKNPPPNQPENPLPNQPQNAVPTVLAVPLVQAVQNVAQPLIGNVETPINFQETLRQLYEINQGRLQAANREDLLEVLEETYENGVALIQEANDSEIEENIFFATKNQLQTIVEFLEKPNSIEEKSLLKWGNFKKAFDELLKKSAQTTDPKTRKVLLGEFRKLLEANKSNLHSKFTYLGGTVLHGVAMKDNAPIELVAMLSKYGLIFDSKDNWGNTPLVWAIANANNSMAYELIRYTPNPNLRCLGNTALVLAIAKGYTNKSANGQILTVSNFQLAERLIDYGADVNMHGHYKMTPLHIAYLRRDTAMVQFLLRMGARKDVRNAMGETPEAMAKKTYSQASEMLKNIAGAFLLLDPLIF